MENLTQTPETAPQTETTKPQTPRSAAQIAASRANGAKSKGPVTEEGKARAAQNSRRHGLLAEHAVMEYERTEAFVDLSSDLYENFQPLDEHERNLVDTMAIAMWRRTRALGMETSGLTHIIRKQYTATFQNLQPNTPIPHVDAHTLAFHGLVANSNEQRVLDLLHRYEARHTRTYERALKSLLAYRKANQTNPSPALESVSHNLHEPTPPAIPESIQAPAPQPATASTPEIQPIEPKPAPAPIPRPHNNHPSRTSFKKISRKNRRRK